MSTVPQAGKILGNDDLFNVLFINSLKKTPEYSKNVTIFYSNYR